MLCFDVRASFLSQFVGIVRFVDVRPYFDRALRVAKRLRDKERIAFVLMDLGELLTYTEEFDAAESVLKEARPVVIVRF